MFEIRRKYGLPIVFLTAFSDEVTKSKAARVNPLAYIVKPYSETELRDTLNKLFGKNILN